MWCRPRFGGKWPPAVRRGRVFVIRAEATGAVIGVSARGAASCAALRVQLLIMARPGLVISVLRLATSLRLGVHDVGRVLAEVVLVAWQREGSAARIRT